MADIFSKEKRSEIMSKIKSKSSIERIPKVYQDFHLRAHPRGIYGKPDFANKKRKIALFIDGCFWHGCPEHFKCPKTRVEFWRAKIDRNKRRDAEVNEHLLDKGWTVIRIWECELKKYR